MQKHKNMFILMQSNPTALQLIQFVNPIILFFSQHSLVLCRIKTFLMFSYVFSPHVQVTVNET